MDHTTGTLLGSRLRRLHYERWLPTNPRAVVVLLHGYSEHQGRYAHVIAALGERGYAVYALDHRGHGQSGGHGQSAGPRANVERFEDFVADLGQFVALVRREQPALPCYLLAHSMGGLIAVSYLVDHPATVDGVILSSPALEFGAGVPGWIKRLGGVLAVAAPRLAVTKPSSAPILSRDPTVDQRFAADPLCYHGQVQARMGHQLMRGSQALRGRYGAITAPILVMHGTADQVASPAGSQALFDGVASVDKTLRWWPDSLHELLNDLDQAAVIACILAWLDAHLALRG